MMTIKRSGLIVTLTLMTGTTWAVDFTAQPRIDFGIMDYRLELEPVFQSDILDNVDLGLTNNPFLNVLGAQGTADVKVTSSQNSVKLDDDMPFASLGMTLFADRWYADFSYLKAFDGESSSRFQQISTTDATSQEATLLNGAVFNRFFGTTQVELNSSDEFDRSEFNFTLGYALTEQFTVFGGYRYSTTDLDSQRHGNISERNTISNNGILLQDTSIHAAYSDLFQADFRQQGPFIGAAYSAPIDGTTLSGALNINAAITYLDAKLKASISSADFSQVQIVDNITGETLPSSDALTPPPELGNFSGDTIGISLGLSWRGLTSVDGLTYGIGVNAYSYQFKSDESGPFLGNISERVIRYQLGVAYQF